MPVVVVLVLLLLVVAVVGLVVVVVRNTQMASGPAEIGPEQVRPVVLEFHVKGDEATVLFGVPLPEGEPDPVLKELLLHAAMDVLREKRSHDLPLGTVKRIRVFGRRGQEPVEVGVVELPEEGELPEVRVPELIPRAGLAGYDPLAHLGEMEVTVPPTVAERPPAEKLRPFHDEIRLTRELEAALRAQGIDPEAAGLEDLVLGLLRAAGYQVSVGVHGFEIAKGGKAHAYTARKGGTETIVLIVPHAEGEYPELDEQMINRFLVWFGQTSPERGLLITDKYGPYLIYEKERREPRCRFITRERLQSFIDSFSLA